jgi:hypothetical protein
VTIDTFEITARPGHTGSGFRERFGAHGTEVGPTSVGPARDGLRSISARALRCSRRITTTGGMCGPTAPTALRRRSFRSSDRGRGFVFGSSLGRPSEHDDCLARAGPPACWRRRSHEPPSAPPPGGTHGSPHDGVLRDDDAGYDAAFFGMRASGAQTSTPPGVNVRGERSLLMYAGNRGRTERRSSNHRPPLFGASAGSRTSLFGDASR